VVLGQQLDRRPHHQSRSGGADQRQCDVAAAEGEAEENAKREA